MSSTQEVINRARCAEALDIWGEKAREYERLTRAKTVADIILFFCGNTADCRDEFFELNKLQDVGELRNLYPKLEEYQKTKSITVATDCMEWLAKLLEIDDEKEELQRRLGDKNDLEKINGGEK